MDTDTLWYNYDLSDARDIIKCIKHIQKICRDSLEYDEWQRHCKYKDAKFCPICQDDYYENNSKCESHHHPKTLFDVVEEVVDDHIEKNDIQDISGFDMCREVMDLHQFKRVSYINLCQHCHKKYHAGHPDVIEKMNLLFAAREQEERKKERVEDIEEEIIISDTTSLEDIEFIPPEPLQDLEDIQIVEKSLIEVPEVLEHKDFSKPKVLNIETSNDFISIDINEL